jgi:aspartyl/glutamyl-tRNA(Asn/Gln) amidotransferase C subunit
MSNDYQIERFARLANLNLQPEELAALSGDFENVVAFINHLQSAPAEDLPVTNQVTDLENIYRIDDVVQYEHHRTLVDLAPSTVEGLVRVPGVFAEGDSDGT